MKVKFEWNLTCSACPLQYDILLLGVPVAYFRYRWGHITVCEYDEFGNIANCIMNLDHGDNYSGCLSDCEMAMIKPVVEREIIKYMFNYKTTHTGG